MDKIKIIAGNPRSGTSLTCLIHLEMLGADNFIGSKFMGAEAVGAEIGEDDHKIELTPNQEYNLLKASNASDRQEGIERLRKNTERKRKLKLERMLDMNREGFYECPFTVQGVRWEPQFSGVWDKMRSLEGDVCMKVVNSGVARTDPDLIGSIVYVNRHPREVAKSQEKLTGPRREVPEGERYHSPRFFIESTVKFCQWHVAFGKDIPTLVVDHHDILTKPEDTVQEIADFYGVDAKNAWSVVKTDLYRSKPEEHDDPTFEDAIAIYKMMNEKNFKGVLDYMRDPQIASNLENKRFKCHRLGRAVALAQCRHCLSKDDVKANYIAFAEDSKIEWEKEPCAYECGAVYPDKAISVEDSVKNHSWLHKSLGVGDFIEKMIHQTGLHRLAKKNCGKCKDRKEALNNLFKRKINFNKPTAGEKNGG